MKVHHDDRDDHDDHHGGDFSDHVTIRLLRVVVRGCVVVVVCCCLCRSVYGDIAKFGTAYGASSTASRASATTNMLRVLIAPAF